MLRISGLSSDVCLSDMPVIDLEIGEPRLPVIGVAVELQDVEPLLQKFDEGEEAIALQPAFIELVGRPVGGGDHYHPALEQRLEQPAEQHGVGDVGDLELVEAQQPGVGGDHVGNAEQGRSEEHTSELPSLMPISYSVFCLK